MHFLISSSTEIENSLYTIRFMSEYTQVGSCSKAYLTSFQNHMRSRVWKCTCKELWSFQKSHVISEKQAVHIFWTTHRRKIVLYSIFIRKNGFLGYFMLFFINIDEKSVKIKKKWKKVTVVFSGGPHCSKLAQNWLLTFVP